MLWSAPTTAHPLDGLVALVLDPAFEATDALPLIGNAFQLVHVRNEGAAFGLLPGKQPVFIATSVIVLIVVGAYWRKARPSSWPVVTPLALISAGALGNLIDRALLGKVTDFFDASFIDFPVFNVADSAIVVGVGILIAWLLLGPQPEAERGRDDECASETRP